jgi:uncharacterized protein (TIRG00374 family)
MKKKALAIAGWIISIALIVMMALKLDFHAIWRELMSANAVYLAAAAVLNFAVIALKSLRWQWLMRPWHRIGFLEATNATFIGLAYNNLLPARGGDWLKVYLLGKWHDASRTRLVSIVGLDKLFDGVAMILLFFIIAQHSSFPHWVRQGAYIIMAVIAFKICLAYFLIYHDRKTNARSANELGFISRLAKRLGSGLVALTDVRISSYTLVLSIFVCALQIATIMLCQLAFSNHIGLWIPPLVFLAINLAITIPSAPSGVGPFEAAAVLVYSWLGISAEVGFGIAIAYHIIQFIPVTLTGVILLFTTHKVDAIHRIPSEVR